MVQFCDEVAHAILQATGTGAVEEVIRNSFTTFRETKNSYNEKAYIINMIVTLQSIKPMAKTIQEVCNITQALKLFRHYNRTDTNQLF